MRLSSVFLRYAIGPAATVALASLSACTGPETRAPGPHQGSKFKDGKDHVNSVVGIQPGDTTEGINLNAPGPHQTLDKCDYKITRDPHTSAVTVELTIPVVTTGDDLGTKGAKGHKHNKHMKVVVLSLPGEKLVHAPLPVVSDN